MRTRTQPKSWLCASSLLAAFAISPSALAAHSAMTARVPLPSAPKTEPGSVKPSLEEISARYLGVVPAARRASVREHSARASAALPPSALSTLVLPARTPSRLALAAEPKPLPEPTSTRNEILWHGLRIPTIIAFGLSGLSAGGAVATGFAASRGNDPRTCDSSCAEHDVRQRALLLTTGVLTGMAAAGIGIGVTFMVKAPKNRERSAIRPRFDASITGQKAVAKIGWVFSSF